MNRKRTDWSKFDVFAPGKTAAQIAREAGSTAACVYSRRNALRRLGIGPGDTSNVAPASPPSDGMRAAKRSLIYGLASSDGAVDRGFVEAALEALGVNVRELGV